MSDYSLCLDIVESFGGDPELFDHPGVAGDHDHRGYNKHRKKAIHVDRERGHVVWLFAVVDIDGDVIVGVRGFCGGLG